MDQVLWQYSFVRGLSLQYWQAADTLQFNWRMQRRDYPARYEDFSLDYFNASGSKQARVEVFMERMREAEIRLFPLALNP